jgi:uncharacterized protein (DUF427 family)
VWDHPRTPCIKPVLREVVVRAGQVEIARTQRALRVLETASPPTVYIPRTDVVTTHLHPAPGASYCEWKGAARYWTVSTPSLRLEAVGWSYDDP